MGEILSNKLFWSFDFRQANFKMKNFHFEVRNEVWQKDAELPEISGMLAVLCGSDNCEKKCGYHLKELLGTSKFELSNWNYCFSREVVPFKRIVCLFQTTPKLFTAALLMNFLTHRDSGVENLDVSRFSIWKCALFVSSFLEYLKPFHLQMLEHLFNKVFKKFFLSKSHFSFSAVSSEESGSLTCALHRNQRWCISTLHCQIHFQYQHSTLSSRKLSSSSFNQEIYSAGNAFRRCCRWANCQWCWQ